MFFTIEKRLAQACELVIVFCELAFFEMKELRDLFHAAIASKADLLCGIVCLLMCNGSQFFDAVAFEKISRVGDCALVQSELFQPCLLGGLFVQEQLFAFDLRCLCQLIFLPFFAQAQAL